MTEDRTQELLLLGKIDGKVDALMEGQAAQSARLNSMDARLRTVEQKAAVIGAMSGGAMSIGVALIIEGLKQWLAGPKGP